MVRVERPSRRWTEEEARSWYDRRPWACGLNFLPSTAVNSTDMWQAESFDLPTVERELAWAADIGINSIRTFVQYLVWESDSVGLMERVDRFLAAAGARGISAMFCLFDDCSFGDRKPYLGRQGDPVPGVHNARWTPSPGPGLVEDRDAWPRLEGYVRGIVGRFAEDDRVLAWDLYNEPGNTGMGARSLPLLEAASGWARSASPSQPLTVGVWNFGPEMRELSERSVAISDVVSFHSYEDLAKTEARTRELQERGRPVLCTEWMARTLGSRFETHLPFFRRESVGSYSFGLVNGRIQTHFPWGSPEGGPEPDVWFCDLLHPDGSYYDDAEIEVIRNCAGEES